MHQRCWSHSFILSPSRQPWWPLAQQNVLWASGCPLCTAKWRRHSSPAHSFQGCQGTSGWRGAESYGVQLTLTDSYARQTGVNRWGLRIIMLRKNFLTLAFMRNYVKHQKTKQFCVVVKTRKAYARSRRDYYTCVPQCYDCFTQKPISA